MKFCGNCKSTKEKKDFNKCSSRRDGLQTQCRDCTKIRNNLGYRENPKRKASIKKTRDENKIRNRSILTRYKRMCGCGICGEKEPVALDLHHPDPSVKEGNPSSFVNYSLKSLRKEIRKCVVLCANCHRKVHAGILII